MTGADERGMPLLGEPAAPARQDSLGFPDRGGPAPTTAAREDGTEAVESAPAQPSAAGPSARAASLPPSRASLPPRPSPQSARMSAASRPVTRGRRARLAVKRVDPWSVFLYSVVASLFLGVVLIVAVGVLYGVLSGLGVLTSVNTLIRDVTAEPGTTTGSGHFFTFGKTMTFAVLLAALNVVLLTVLATLAALLYNVCSALTGGIEVTLSDHD